MSNITRTYTFTDGTIAYGSQVDSEVANIVNTWNNHDAGTSRWTVTDATTLKIGGQDVTQYLKYRRPVLQYNSGTVVNVETGINGTSGQLAIMFPDGSYRTDSTTTRIQCNLAQVAALTVTAQSGLRTGTVAANTWYSFYAVKSQVNSTDIVIVADTLVPTQTNYASLNTNFGSNSWVYLGCVPYGDNAGATTAVPTFVMSGSKTCFYNSTAGTQAGYGLQLAGATATSLTYTYAAGTALGSAQTPAQLLIGDLLLTTAAQASVFLLDAAAAYRTVSFTPSAGVISIPLANWPLSRGQKENSGNNVAKSIYLTGYFDAVLGVGPNPLL